MRLLTVVLACLIFITPSQAAENQIEQRLQIQQGRLKNIEEQASMKRLQIEDWYLRSFSEIRQLAERQAKQLQLNDRAIWTEFAKMNEQTPQFDTYFKKSSLIFTRDTKSYEFHAALADSYFLSSAADLLMDDHFRKLLINLSNGSAYNPQSFLTRIQARKLLYFANEFESMLTNLQDRKKAKLTAIEQWRQDLRADVLRIMREIKTGPEKVNVGVVSAIIYNQKDSLCMVDGTDRMLKEGDSIGSVAIVKIYPEQVEFIKNGQKWTQEVSKPANAAWR